MDMKKNRKKQFIIFSIVFILAVLGVIFLNPAQGPAFKWIKYSFLGKTKLTPYSPQFRNVPLRLWYDVAYKPAGFVSGADYKYNADIELPLYDVQSYTETREYKINRMIETMSTPEILGQIFMVSVNNDAIDEITTLIRNYHIGGVIHFGNTLQNKENAVTMNQAFQEIALEVNKNIGLFIATDQEGGIVSRLPKKHCPLFPPNAVYGKNKDINGVKKQARLTAHALKEYNINMNLAPVLDLSNSQRLPIGVRAYSSNPKEVAFLGSAYIRVLQNEGIIATAKHFPGHGATISDSHAGAPVVNLDRNTLRTHMQPFKAAIGAGVEAIMSAHITYKSYDPFPATFSNKLLDGILRKEYGFNGLIVTDALNMGAVTDSYLPEEAAYKSVEAGADILLLVHRAGLQNRIFNSLIKRMRTSESFFHNVQESVYRILYVKDKYGILK